jgi:hypothetical protein
MSTKISRRLLLTGGALGAAGLALHRLGARVAARDVVAGAPRGAARADARVAALVALSRDPSGAPHVEAVAFLEAGAVSGTLPVTRAEAETLVAALAVADFAAFQRGGLRLAGRTFRFIDAERDEGATVLHAVRPGEFVTVRASSSAPALVVIATSGAGMAHGRAVDAVARFARHTLQFA